MNVISLWIYLTKRKVKKLFCQQIYHLFAQDSTIRANEGCYGLESHKNRSSNPAADIRASLVGNFINLFYMLLSLEAVPWPWWDNRYRTYLNFLFIKKKKGLTKTRWFFSGILGAIMKNDFNDRFQKER